VSTPETQLRCAFDSCVLADHSGLARLMGTGPDFLGLLHRLSTGDVSGLTAGQGAATVLTSPKGRIVERLFVHHTGSDGVLAVCGIDGGPRVMEHLARYTFAEQTGLSEVSGTTSQFALIGPRLSEVLEAAGLDRPAPHGANVGSIGGAAVHVVGEDGLSAGGVSVVTASETAPAVRAALETAVTSVDGVLAGCAAIESYRILRGLPASGHELTADYNPLEAGLWDAVSFEKGCYVGQEVVARLRTYDKVSRVLVGLELPADGVLPPPHAPLLIDGRAAGTLTSAILPPNRRAPVGLGYLKRREIRPGLVVGFGQHRKARVVELPFQ
jgi:folate-binding protein YgfZ